jgi:cation diffusion facilitator CzcD-associated flavoprotein CzcO
LGTHVAVIGGGDNAFDVSRMLAEKGVRRTMVMRAKSRTGSPLLVERLRRIRPPEWRTAGGGNGYGARTGRVERSACGSNDGGSDHRRPCRSPVRLPPNTSEPWIAELALEKDRAAI